MKAWSKRSGGGWVLADTPAPPPKTPPAAAHEHGAGPTGAGAEHGMMGGGMGMMGGGMGMMGAGMCSVIGGAGTKVVVKNVDKGVTITLTSNDPATVTRLQKMAEAMRLMHEATTSP